MICNKCGKNNDAEETRCTACGEALPGTENCGGFADILTFTPPAAEPAAPVAVKPAPEGEVLTKAEKKSLEEKAKRGIKFGIFAILISLIVSAGTLYYAYNLQLKAERLEQKLDFHIMTSEIRYEDEQDSEDKKNLETVIEPEEKTETTEEQTEKDATEEQTEKDAAAEKKETDKK